MGTVVISIDAELGWGFHDLQTLPERIEHARDGWQYLVDLLDEYDLPATWAVVGHLLLEECDGTHGDHPLGPDWFSRERTTWAQRPDLRFADGLVEAVRESGPDHEIGCHTFSHVEFGAPQTSAEVARAELAASQRAATARGIELSSLVFPRNSIGHRRELAAAGFDCYRGRTPNPDSPTRKLLDATDGTPTPRIVQPAVDDWGLVNLPASLHLFGFEGLARTLVEPVFGDPIVEHVERGLAAVADDDGVFHVWLHPSSVSDERDRSRIRQICERIDAYRPAVDVATMATVAEQIRAEEPRQRASGRP